MAISRESIGCNGFVRRHALRSKEGEEVAERILRIVSEKNLQTIRISFADQHGILRGKTIMADDFEYVLSSGCKITSTLL